MLSRNTILAITILTSITSMIIKRVRVIIIGMNIRIKIRRITGIMVGIITRIITVMKSVILRITSKKKIRLMFRVQRKKKKKLKLVS